MVIRHGWRDGLTPAEMLARASKSKAALSTIAQDWENAGADRRRCAPASATTALTVLAARDGPNHPGIVFAHAAATGEIDALTDLDSRLFVGLPAHAPGCERHVATS